MTPISGSPGTSTPPAGPLRAADLGTLVVIPWSGDHPADGGQMPFLLAYSLGDGHGGPHGSAVAVAALLHSVGLPVGGPVVDGTQQPGLPVTLLVEAGQAVVTMRHLNAQCPVPPEWLTAVRQRGHASFIFSTLPWPEGSPGTPVTAEALQAYVGSEETLNASAHCLVPVTTLRS
ncbi:DUF5949 family protein [Streptomyces sp. NPDC050560]|uniref:DUF5949 family protein n=1 Tax=Streptomyces sp. NPDC050560 TaxID=3365630 RepID=UPI0037A413CF